MENKVAFINGKGGCGKTTSIFHVAGVYAHRGDRVLIIDLDKQRNTTRVFLTENEKEVKHTMFDYMKGTCDVDDIVMQAYFKVRDNANPRYYGVDVLPSDVRFEDERRLRNINIKTTLDDFIKRQGYDWVLVDMPPSNKTMNNICFTQIADNVIAPFSSDIFSVEGYADLMEIVNEARDVNENLHILGIYLSRYMSNCSVDKFIKKQLEQFGDIFLDIQIPLMADLREAVMLGRPMSFYKKSSKSRVAYESLANIIEMRIKEVNV